MTKRSARDPSTWQGATAEELRAMFAEASPEATQALLDWARANWVVEPGRFPDSFRLRDPNAPSSQIALMPGLEFRQGELGRSSLSLIRQQVLLAAAERTSLWDMHFGTREQVSAAIDWAIESGWIALAAEHGADGRLSGTWTELSSEQARRELRGPQNWSAGPYPPDGDFSEVFALLTARGREAVASGVADDAIRASFS